MKKLTTALSLIALLALGALAQSPNTRQVRDAVRSLNSKLDDVEQSFRYQMQANSVDRGAVDAMTDDIRDLRDRVLQFEDNLNAHRENRDDVKGIVASAQRLNETMTDLATNGQMERDWRTARDQVDRIAREYGVVAQWNAGAANNANYTGVSTGSRPQVRPMPPVRDDDNNGPVGTLVVGLSGTYTLDRQRSENVDDIVTSANAGANQQDLRDKLEAPEQISIDIRGNQVTLATSSASPVTFVADGREKTQTANGRTIKLRATLSGDTLVVSSIGGETDYNITFTSVSNGRGLKVSRRITTDYLSQTVFAESFYNKTDSVASLGTGPVRPIDDRGGSTPASGGTTYDPNGGYSDNDNSGTVANGGNASNRGYNPRSGNGGQPQITTRSGDFYVPNGVTLTGRLENEINSKVSQNGDRFRLTVQSPAEYRGAVIEGYISGVGRSGKISGQSNISFNFERITLRDGKTYDFAGQLMQIADAQGKLIKVDNEGTARGDSQTKETAKRGGAGAGLGALIGAIAGGGKGAAIGAIIGGGAAASTVLVTGKDDIELLPGSTITVQSTSPNQNYQR